ncbi:MAG: hypothetical protein ACE15C_12225 [Phycisphaerae bacterium]
MNKAKRITNNEQEISNIESPGAQSCTRCVWQFDIRYFLFDIRYFLSENALLLGARRAA